MAKIDTIIALIIVVVIGYVLYKFVWPMLNPTPEATCTQDSDCDTGNTCKDGICRPRGDGPGGGDTVEIKEKKSKNIIGVNNDNLKRGGRIIYGSSSDVPHSQFVWDDDTSQFYLIDKDTGDRTNLCINAGSGAKDGHVLTLYDCNTCTFCSDCTDTSICDDCGTNTCNKDNQWYFNEDDVNDGVIIKPITSKQGTNLAWQLMGTSNKQVYLKTPQDNKTKQFQGYQLFKIKTSQ